MAAGTPLLPTWLVEHVTLERICSDPAVPVRVLHVITGLSYGGAERMLVKLVSALQPDIEQTVACLSVNGPLGAEIEAAGVPLVCLGMRAGRFSPRSVLALARLTHQVNPAIVQTWLYHADLVGLIAARLLRLRRRPKVLWNVRCSNMELQHYKHSTTIVLRLLRQLASWPEGVIVNSEAGRRAHHRLGYRPQRWIEIPNGFDTERFRPDKDRRRAARRLFAVDSDNFVIGMTARVDPMKNHSGLLDAFAVATAAAPHLRLILIGPGTEGLKAAVEGRGLTDRIRLLGLQRQVEVLLPGLDLCVLASSFGEGFPNVLGEAMACGVPCLSTDVGDAAKIIGESGWIVPPGDRSRLAAALGEIARLPPERRLSAGKAARARITEHYALSRVTARYRQLYLDLALAKT